MPDKMHEEKNEKRDEETGVWRLDEEYGSQRVRKAVWSTMNFRVGQWRVECSAWWVIHGGRK